MTGKSEVPALDRGLDILEAVSAHGSMGYKAITDSLAFPPASVARILKNLCQRRYLAKSAETGEYAIGPGAIALFAAQDPSTRLRDAGSPILKQLRDTLLQTAILLHWNGTAWECIAKEAHEDSITMQKEGEIRVDIYDYPWSAFVFDQLRKEKRRLVMKVKEKELEAAYQGFERSGYVVSRGGAFNRFAVPIRTRAGDLLGALALGVVHNSEAYDEPALIEWLIRGGKQITEQLWRSVHDE